MTTTTRRFEQEAHGEAEYGQTPATMFLEAWTSHGEPEAVLFRLTVTGKEQVHEVLRTREDVLRGVLSMIDGQRTTFEQDDESTRLTCREPARRFFRLQFLNGKV